MAQWSVRRKLRATSRRLRRLREQLAVIDQQLEHLRDDTEDKSLRALVADSPEAAQEARQAAGHSEAMAQHRRKVLTELQSLEGKQDRLLDELRLR